MTTYLINHLRLPNGVPKSENLDYLEKAQATFTPYGVVQLAGVSGDPLPQDRQRHQRPDPLVDPLGANFTAAEWAGEIRGVIAAA